MSQFCSEGRKRTRWKDTPETGPCYQRSRSRVSEDMNSMANISQLLAPTKQISHKILPFQRLLKKKIRISGSSFFELSLPE